MCWRKRGIASNRWPSRSRRRAKGTGSSITSTPLMIIRLDGSSIRNQAWSTAESGSRRISGFSGESKAIFPP